jgi:hypothetical protein
LQNRSGKTQFPPANFAGIHAVPEIEDKISQIVVKRVGSSVTLAAIWGYGIDSFDELRENCRAALRVPLASMN